MQTDDYSKFCLSCTIMAKIAYKCLTGKPFEIYLRKFDLIPNTFGVCVETFKRLRLPALSLSENYQLNPLVFSLLSLSIHFFSTR